MIYCKMEKASLCRLCLHKNEIDCMKNIFEFSPKYFELNLTEILYWIFDVEIVAEDAYSKSICYKCLNVIESVGRYRKFFQMNQLFLHERRCPADYQVEMGWYNKKDVGTNTHFKHQDYVTLSIKDVNALSKPQVHITKLNDKEIHKNTLLQETSPTKPVAATKKKIEWLNVPSNIFKEFGLRNMSLKTVATKDESRINVPLDVFDYFPTATVTVASLKEECAYQGYAKMDNIFYKVEKQTAIHLKRIDIDKKFLKTYRKIGRYTFKKIPPVRDIREELLKNKQQLIQDYYYRIPTSALRELISDTTPPNKKTQISNISLVKKNEVHVHVCEYCSKVFRFKKNLKEHCFNVHRSLVKSRRKSASCQSEFSEDLDVDVLEARRSEICSTSEINEEIIPYNARSERDSPDISSNDSVDVVTFDCMEHTIINDTEFVVEKSINIKNQSDHIDISKGNSVELCPDNEQGVKSNINRCSNKDTLSGISLVKSLKDKLNTLRSKSGPVLMSHISEDHSTNMENVSNCSATESSNAIEKTKNLQRGDSSITTAHQNQVATGEKINFLRKNFLQTVKSSINTEHQNQVTKGDQVDVLRTKNLQTINSSINTENQNTKSITQILRKKHLQTSKSSINTEHQNQNTEVTMSEHQNQVSKSNDQIDFLRTKHLPTVKSSVNTDFQNQVTNDDNQIDFLKKVIFGECSQFNPKITYHNSSDNVIVKDHPYAKSNQ